MTSSPVMTAGRFVSPMTETATKVSTSGTRASAAPASVRSRTIPGDAGSTAADTFWEDGCEQARVGEGAPQAAVVLVGDCFVRIGGAAGGLYVEVLENLRGEIADGFQGFAHRLFQDSHGTASGPANTSPSSKRRRSGISIRSSS